MTLTDYMCQENREEEDLPALMITLTHRYNDSTTTQNHEGRITATRNNTDNTRIRRTTKPKMVRKTNPWTF